jgi:hypothetical protein
MLKNRTGEVWKCSNDGIYLVIGETTYANATCTPISVWIPVIWLHNTEYPVKDGQKDFISENINTPWETCRGIRRLYE